MKILIAIDDTDNLESRGTGFRSRELAQELGEHNLAIITEVTRHQLYVHDNIPFTSHNSSACLYGDAIAPIEQIIEYSAEYLKRNSAEGSDAGLCVSPYDTVSDEIIAWGLRAKVEVITQKEAREVAARGNVFLEGYTGTKGGIIGSLAAVGLSKAGNDGRYLLTKGMRKHTGIFKAKEILEITGVEIIKPIDNSEINPDTTILMQEWWRPILQNHKATLLIEKSNEQEDHEWQVVTKDYIKRISQ